jgi:tRNA pseudouridine55 synthase
LPTSSTSPGSVPDGLILVDKEAGITSHDVVARVRRRLGRGVKVGHAGTLDPFATGLLLVLVGRATRVQRFVMALPKRYEVVARLGWTSTTGDPEGELAQGRTPPEPLALPTGAVRQRPPAHSAVKVGGQRAYRLARRGEAVDLPEREVAVHRFDALWRDGDRAAFTIECSSGTYVRSLIAALGDAYCLELRRTGIGAFDVAAADPGRIVPLGDALGFLPAVTLEGEAARRAAHGVAVAAADAVALDGEGARRAALGAVVAAPGAAAGAAVRLLDDDGLIALAEPRADGLLKPSIGFRG